MNELEKLRESAHRIRRYALRMGEVQGQIDRLRGQAPWNTGLANDKLMTLEALKHELDSRRRLGQRVAFTNGCFDVLHAGHVQYLQWKKYYQILAEPNRNSLWCYPNSPNGR